MAVRKPDDKILELGAILAVGLVGFSSGLVLDHWGVNLGSAFLAVSGIILCLGRSLRDRLPKKSEPSVKPHKEQESVEPHEEQELPEKDSTEQSLVLERLMEMLENLKIGYIVLDERLIVDRNASDTLCSLLGCESITGKDAIEVLFGEAKLKPEEKAQMSFQLRGLFGMGETQWKISRLTFVKIASVERGGELVELRFHYFPYFDDHGVIEQIMIAVEDITEYQSAKKQADSRQQEMEKVFTLLQVSDSIFDFFIEETRLLLHRLEEDVRSLRSTPEEQTVGVLERVFRSVHTIKGNSKLFALHSIQEVAHSAENWLSELMEKSLNKQDTEIAVESLSQMIAELNEEVESYANLRKKLLRLDDGNSNLSIQYRIQWIKSLIHQLSSTLRTTRFDIREVGRIQGDFARALSSFEKTSILEYLPRYENMIEEFCLQLGKKANRLRQDMDYRYFDAESLGKINDFLVQSLRNSIDHGIEPPESREKSGKNSSGTITISSKSVQGQVFVSVEDDGQGIDVETIVSKAIKKGILQQSQVDGLADHDKINLIFRSGLTTMEEVSRISGRGVGMDAVQEISRELGGTVTIDTKPGLGTKVTLQFPEKAEEFLSPFAIYDFHSLMDNIIDEFRVISKCHVSINYENRLTKPPFFLGDQLSISEIAKSIFMDFFRRTPNEGSINCWLESFKGRRRVDSHEFFRLTFDCSIIASGSEEVWSADWKRAEMLIKSHRGSLIYRDDVQLLELNLPSFLPVEFNGYKIIVLFYSQLNRQLSPVVNEYFTKTFKGWSFEIFAIDSANDLPAEAEENPVIAFVEGDAMYLYQKTRSEINRERDSVIMISNTTEGIDCLEDTSIMPDNLVFLPMPLRKPAVLQALTTVMLRRFASEMVRDSGDGASQRVILGDLDRRAS